jgi:hypothetical protein
MIMFQHKLSLCIVEIDSMGLELFPSCINVSVFWLWWEIGYCAVVSVFLLWREIGYLGRYVGIFFYKRS